MKRCACVVAVCCCVVLTQSVFADQFQDVTEQVGLKGLSGGVAAWGDFDNDGWVDLYTDGQLWRNEQGKRFSPVKDLPRGGAAIWGDFDNDGFLDLFSWSEGALLRNLKGKGFEVVADGVGKLPTTVSLGATWGDFNGDGFLDLYIGGYEVWPSEEFPDVILVNQNGQKFVEHIVRRAPGRGAAEARSPGQDPHHAR